jgi:Bacterial archaeo-eukaryotic release factor family 11
MRTGDSRRIVDPSHRHPDTRSGRRAARGTRAVERLDLSADQPCFARRGGADRAQEPRRRGGPAASGRRRRQRRRHGGQEELADLVDDDEFWRYQARSLALFLTPTTATTFRLPNQLVALVDVSDRFRLKPLLRALTFPHTALVLALSQNAVRLLEIAPDLEPAEIKIPDLPKDVASAVGKSSIRDRAPSGRLQGSEGQKTRMRQYARQIDQALRPLLTGWTCR